MRITAKNKLFKHAILKGNSVKDSMKIAGYSIKKDNTNGYKLMKKMGIIDALDNNGLDDTTLVKAIRDNMISGVGIKATADTSLKAIELSLRLKKYLTNDTQLADTTNVFINELKVLPDSELLNRLHSIDADIVHNK